MSELESIEKQTAALTKLGLKSNAAVIQRLCPAIAEAQRAGYSHRAIHNTLCAAGLLMTWTNYRIALGRASKASAPTVKPGADFAHAAADPAFSATQTSSTPQESGETCSVSSTSSATRVMDGLRHAREVAHSKDYGQIGRDLYRQQQRDQKHKDRS